MWKIIVIVGLTALAAGCSEIEPIPMEPSQGHISTEQQPAGEIPELVEQVPILPEPAAPVELEKYTVVVNEVPAKELLFALARDAKINVDIDPDISGVVTINAVEQTLPQVLDRIARQVDLRYAFEGENLIIEPDEPYLRIYKVSYVNLSRDTEGSIAVSTQIDTAGSGGAGGGGSNNSMTAVSSISRHRFWETLTQNIHAILGEEPEAGETGSITSTASVIVSPESGIISVRATEEQHHEIQKFIDQVLVNVQRQILIEATIVEVILSDQYQAGIDWSSLRVAAAGGLSLTAALVGASTTAGLITSTLTAVPPFTGTSSSFAIGYDNPESVGRNISATLSLLREFGDTQILSSPQLMVLNNHTAIIKVVENFVYFSVKQEVAPATVAGGAPAISTTTTAETVPVGLVMAVTPQVDENDVITLDIRPTITSVVSTVSDPHPDIALANEVPVIRVREMESILRINSQQIAVLGGLMQDTNLDIDKDTPVLSDIPIIGNAFKARERRVRKSELVIFLRPSVIRDASLDGDLQKYKQYLERQQDIDSVKPKTKLQVDSQQ